MLKFTSMALLLALSLVAPMKAFCNDYSQYYTPGKHKIYMYGMSNMPHLNQFITPGIGPYLWGPLHYVTGGGKYSCWNGNVGILVKSGRYCLTVSPPRVYFEKHLINAMNMFNRAVETRSSAIKKITGVNMEKCKVEMIEDVREGIDARALVTVDAGSDDHECMAFFRVFMEDGLFNRMDTYPWNMQPGGEFIRKTGTIRTKPDSVIEIGEARKGPVKVTAVRGCDEFMQRIDPRKLSEGEVLKGTVKPAEQMKYGTNVCTLDVLWDE